MGSGEGYRVSFRFSVSHEVAEHTSVHDNQDISGRVPVPLSASSNNTLHKMPTVYGFQTGPFEEDFKPLL